MKLNRRFNVAKLMHCSLDLFMLQMHSEEIAAALDSLSTFGERVLPIMKRNPGSDDWWLSSDLLIDRRRWDRLARHVMNLIHLLGVGANDHHPDFDRRRQSAPCTHATHSSADLTRLRSAVERARSAFGDFAEPDREQRTLRELYWPSVVEEGGCLSPGPP
jgi:hypothetical protein